MSTPKRDRSDVIREASGHSTPGELDDKDGQQAGGSRSAEPSTPLRGYPGPEAHACNAALARRERPPAPIVRKRAVYICGCARAVDAPQGQEPRPPMQCPEHGAEWTILETLDPKGGEVCHD